MQPNQKKDKDRSTEEKDPFQVQAPAINLPRGGGAIKGIDEKFTVNPATGTGSMQVPIFTSPGRSGFQPRLSLSYNSGTGNGPFGMGWNLSVPSITRKTDKGIPRYLDHEDSDTFILSAAEDLVPVLDQDAEGNWVPRTPDNRVLEDKHYTIQFYRPRIEGLFARIEKWTNSSEKKDVFWRVITRDNMTSIYGKHRLARIEDQADRSRIFTWLLDCTFDDKGNIITYEYKEENDRRVVADSIVHHESWHHERNRLSDQTHARQRYLKRIRYGNQTPYDFSEAQPNSEDFLFEVVFDYGDHSRVEETIELDGQAIPHVRNSHSDDLDWPCRPDPFSSYRSGFEIRTYRLCRRVLMFHHFSELGSLPCLVRSTDFTYAENPVATKLVAATQTGYKRSEDDAPYRFKTFPPIEFRYAEPRIDHQVRQVPDKSMENLPIGLDNQQYQWIDLDGEGISGILSEQDGGWFYKPNGGDGDFGPSRLIATQPSCGRLSDGKHRLLDLAGDGQLDCVVLDDPITGFYERNTDLEWSKFKFFQSVPNVDWQDPNLRLIDLNGDGHADLLITENELFVWHPSLKENGYGESQAVHKALDEEKGPTVVFADISESIYLADMSGDGLTDIVRIRNGDVCYWPNLGYGRFGAKVSMISSPFFDAPDQFDPKRIRLGDIDGTGTSDIFYLTSQVVRFWYNHSGNAWSIPEELTTLPGNDTLTAVNVVDFLGHGTSCLVWSSPLPGHAGSPLRYIDLMGGCKPHLLVNVKNNLGAETRLTYAPSTRFYLDDKKAGTPWITRLAFPVHVVEKVETVDHISQNHFVTRYAYHHGYHDGVEREFRGFGRVDQWDTESYETLSENGGSPVGDNIDPASHVPSVLTKTWFHSGVYTQGAHISKQMACEYYREGDPSMGHDGLGEAQLQAMRLVDTILPDTIYHENRSREPYQLTHEESREACRALKGAILRQEVYAADGTEAEDRPYSASERNYTIELLQPEARNRHAVILTHSRETVDFHYERKLYDIKGQKHADPRVSHTMTLAADPYGNVLQSVAIGYGRRFDDPDQTLSEKDRTQQKQHLLTYTQSQYTDPIQEDNTYRLPQPCDARTYELIHVDPNADEADITNLFRFEEIAQKIREAGDGNHDLPYEDVDASAAVEAHPYRRLIEHVRQLYWAYDLGGPLPMGAMPPRGLPYENYKLALTPGIMASVYQRDGRPLLDDATPILRDEGGYIYSNDYKQRGWFPAEDADDHWWLPSGQSFYAPVAVSSTPLPPPEPLPQDAGYARQHFYLPQGARDPFGAITRLSYDRYDLLLKKTEDPLNNIVTVETRDADGRNVVALDYRVLQPWTMVDPNGNSTEARFDLFGLVTGTAVKGKDGEGDRLTHFRADLHQDQVEAFFTDPKGQIAKDLLGDATTRIIYDIGRYHRLSQTDKPTFAATITREAHAGELGEGEDYNIQVSFGYSDGFGREIQKKIQAEPGPVKGLGDHVDPRWVGSGWTIFNNKGNPVRQYEPFFSTLENHRHDFEFARAEGVSPILFYDPLGRVVCTLHPNHTWEKVVFDAWRQTTFDVNDTLHPGSGETQELQDFIPISPPGAAGLTYVTSLNLQGKMAGYFKDSTGAWRIFLHDNDGFNLVDIPDAAHSWWPGINNSGQMVGSYNPNNPGDDPNVYHGFLKDGDAIDTINHPEALNTFLNDINDSGQIVGCYETDPGTGQLSESNHAFLLEQGEFTPIDFPGAKRTYPLAINNHGQIAGHYRDSQGIHHGFVRKEGVPATIYYPGAKNTVASGIDDTGRIVGSYESVNGQWQGFVLANNIFSTIKGPAGPVIPQDITSSGRIGGYFFDSNGVGHGFDGRMDSTSPFARFNPAQDEDVGHYFSKLDETAYLPTWYNLRTDEELARQQWPEDPRRRASEKRAAEISAQHAATPTVAHLDTLGRPFLTIADNGWDQSDSDRFLKTHVTLDIEGSDLKITDPRQYEFNKTRDETDQVHNFMHTFDMAGRKLRIDSVDAGLQLVFMDVAENPLYAWDGVGRTVKNRYDQLRRPTEVWVREKEAPDFYLVQKTIYGEVKPEAHATNHRLQAWKVYDGAGLATSEAYDFKGNLIEQSRRLLSDGTLQVRWPTTGNTFDENNATVLLEPEENKYASSTQYDALNRIVKSRAPDDTIQEPFYNEANLLDALKVTVNGEETRFVQNIDYDAKGQRTSICYGNKVETEYTYDAETFRLIQLTSKRENAADPDLQNLHHTYDPVGNITAIRDDAHHLVFNHNNVIKPESNYTYDPLYRLVTAAGREHEAMSACHYQKPEQKHTEFIPLTNQPSANGKALCNYYEHYAYDTAGNITEIKHRNNTRHTAWTRHQSYAPKSNRLKTSHAGCPNESPFDYFERHDPNGNITAFPHLPAMRWDFRNQLVQVQLNVGENPDMAYYQYDTGGQRVRKLLVKNNRSTTEERIYIGGYEIYRKRNSSTSLRRDTIHVMDDENRIALVETEKDYDNGSVIDFRVRYQLSNYLGSGILEVEQDSAAQIIGYEEYYPYGDSAYVAGMNKTFARLKRYRYTGKERDNETGLYYYGARYYAAWLGRWSARDPIILSINSFEFCSGNPTSRIDRNGKEDELLIRESNLYYDTDHYEPQSKHRELSNKASNLGFLMADENRRKRAREFSSQPKRRKPISLRKALDSGEVKARHAVTEMLGSRRFSEVHELNELWQIASRQETRSYSDSQREFRRLIATSETEAARTVRNAFSIAEVDILPNKGSFRFRLNDKPYRGKRSPRFVPRGGRGVLGRLITGVLAFLGLTGISAQASAAQASDKVSRTQLLMETESLASTAPGGLATTLAVTGVFAKDAVIKDAVNKTELIYMNQNLRHVHNSCMMLDIESGDVYELSLGYGEQERGELTHIATLERRFPGTIYENEKNRIYQGEDNIYYHYVK